jgi:hypothetical protein
MREIWKPIAGYEGFYEVSSLGRVRSLARGIKCGGPRGWRGTRHYQAKILVPNTTGPYHSIALSKGDYALFDSASDSRYTPGRVES